MGPGVNFIYILRAAFMHVDPKSAKKVISIFTLLESARAKAARKMFVKLTPKSSSVKRMNEMNEYVFSPYYRLHSLALSHSHKYTRIICL